MYCHRCGHKLTSQSLYCRRCGTKVETEEDELDDYLTAPRSSGVDSPPRPARRSPVKPPPRVVASPEPDPEEEEDAYEEEEYEAEEGNREDDDIIFQIGPAFHFVGAAYAAALTLSVLLTSAASRFHLPVSIALVVSFLLFLYPIWMHVENKRVVYTLTSSKLEVEEGLLAHEVRSIPLRHIQDVVVHQPLKNRLMGVGDVIIDSEVEGGRIEMIDIDNPREYADLILDQLQYWR